MHVKVQITIFAEYQIKSPLKSDLRYLRRRVKKKRKFEIFYNFAGV